MDFYRLETLVKFAGSLTEFTTKCSFPLINDKDYDTLKRLKAMALELAESHLQISKEILRTDSLKREVEHLNQQLREKETLIEYILSYEEKSKSSIQSDHLHSYAETYIN